MCSGTYKSLKSICHSSLLLAVSVFKCVYFFFQRVLSLCRLCTASLRTKEMWVLVLFEWIEMIYFKFARVDFIAGQLKFKCADV